MTSERRYLAELADIASIEISCPDPDCGSRLLTLIGAKTPAVCPSCGGPLFDQTEQHWSMVNNLRMSIAAFKSGKPEHVRLELKNVPEKQ